MLRRTAIATAVIVGLLLLCYTLTPHVVASLRWHIRESLFITVPLLLLTALWLLVAAWAANDMVYTPWEMLARALPAGIPLAAITLAWLWWSVSWHHYEQDRAYYTASAVVAPTELPKLATRVPYQMAEAQARSNLGDIAGNIPGGGTTYLPRRSEYGTLVERKGFLTGYEATLTQAVDEAGNVESYVCRFNRDKATERVGGWFNHNIARSVSEHDHALRYEAADVWGYCGDQFEPLVVIPLKRQHGWWYVTERPAGYGLYNGRTGTLTFHTGAAEKLPGSVYPLSIAARQREALKAPGGYWDWRADRTGWEADEEDTNSGNSTEFTLGDAATHAPLYVTPLTGRGSATAISAFSLIDGQAARTGQLAPVTVHRALPVWKSTKAIESRIKADYSDIPNWLTVRLFELAPTGGDEFVATVGVRDGNTIAYRVRGTGALTDPNSTCLHHPEDDTRLRCGRIYTTGDMPTPGEGPPGQPPTGLDRVSDEQLVDEIRRRLGKP